MKYLIFVLSSFFVQFAFGQSGGLNCADMEPICTDAGVSFTANEGGPDASAIDPGNDYGCLITSPNPSWFYLEISDPGDIIMELSAPSDIDFIIWGPYSDLAAAQANCGNHNNIVPDVNCGFFTGCDSYGCSFDITNVETPGIPNAQVGEVYVMLVTNYANNTQQIDLVQTGGNGATDCTIINPTCNISFFEANIGVCDNATGEYEITGVIEFEDAPITGDLIVEDCFGTQHVVASAPFPVGGTVNYTVSNLPANGAACDLTTYFSDDIACQNGPLNYNAPTCANCFMTSISINISACDANGNFEVTGEVEFTDPPATGQLVIEDCNGNSVSFNAPFNSPLAFTIPDIPADGTANCSITAEFTDDAACTITSPTYNNPANCDCTAEVGTFTPTITGSSNNNYVLCYGDEISIETNNDWVAPEEANNPPGPVYDPGVSWLIYSCPPSVAITPDPNNAITDDPCLIGVVSDFDLNDINDLSWITGFPGTFTDNIVYFVPITMYSITELTYSYVNTTDPCYQLGPVFPVQYLPEIITVESSDCQAGSVSVEIEGGLPEIDGSQFTGSNLLPASASFNVQNTGNGGTIIIEGLVDGDNYSFDITDDNGCPVTITGVFQGVEDPAFDYPNDTYCQDETDPVANITGTPGGIFTAAPGGLSINAANGTIDLDASTPGTYTVTYTTPDPVCFASSTYDITILPLPIFNVVGVEPSECGLSDGTITISGLDPNINYNLTYTENGNQIGPQNILTDANGEFIIGNLSTGTFTDFEIELDGCIGTVPDVIQLNDVDAPIVDAGPDQEVCEGTDVVLTADNPDGAIISWDNNVTDGVSFIPGVGSQVYTVTADNAGCLSTDQVNVTVHPNPTVIAGNDITVCENESVILTGSGADNYVWDNGVTDGISFIINQTTTYTVVGTTIHGCTGQDDVTVNVETTGDVSFDADNKEGCAPLTTTFTNTSNFNGTNCTWYLSNGTVLQGCNNVSYTFNNPGCYDVTLEVETANGCIASTTYNDYICIDNDPVAMFTPNPFEISSIDPNVFFSNGSLGANDYHWSFGDGTTSTVTNPNHTYPADQAGEYEIQLIAYSPAGCTDTARAVVTVIEDIIFYVPNTFTPDNDDFNEVFQPIFTSGFDPFDFHLMIFNRWGEVVFESYDASIGWDGTYSVENDRIVRDGTYVWKIEFKTVNTDERQTHLGHVNVLK
ncbi:MAG: hypothetical protein COA32_11475 [Fluviicola sp.]|nr:MAG: hypothetical protein COA32_11475 [Fluviicola sp.]